MCVWIVLCCLWREEKKANDTIFENVNDGIIVGRQCCNAFNYVLTRMGYNKLKCFPKNEKITGFCQETKVKVSLYVEA